MYVFIYDIFKVIKYTSSIQANLIRRTADYFTTLLRQVWITRKFCLYLKEKFKYENISECANSLK